MDDSALRLECLKLAVSLRPSIFIHNSSMGLSRPEESVEATMERAGKLIDWVLARPVRTYQAKRSPTDASETAVAYCDETGAVWR